MQFFVYSRPAIEQVPPHDVPHVIISITSSAHDVAKLPLGPACLGVLRLVFPDADIGTEGVAPESLFGPEHAVAICDFVRAHQPHIQRVVVHCDAGMSRSPAVAAALARGIHGDDSELFRRYRPNMRVYRGVLEAWESGRGAGI